MQPVMTISSKWQFLPSSDYTYTVECRYSAIQHNMILHMVRQWLRQNMHQRLYLQKTSHNSPSLASYRLPLVMIGVKIDRVIAATYYIQNSWFIVISSWYTTHKHLRIRKQVHAVPFCIIRSQFKWYNMYSNCGVLRQTGTSNYNRQYLWDVITCPSPWYLLLAQHSWIDNTLSISYTFRSSDTHAIGNVTLASLTSTIKLLPYYLVKALQLNRGSGAM